MIRFYNGKVLSFENGINLRDGEVWTDGNLISYVGPEKADMPEFERSVDLQGNLVMPSFKDAHTHSAMTALRSYADDLPLNEWLFDQVFPMEAKLSPEHVYTMTQIAIMEYLSSGITSSFDMYFHNDAYVEANVNSGFRTVICGALNDFDKDPNDMEREYLKFNKYNELVSFCLGMHAEYTTGMERMKFVSDLVHKYKTPFFVHNSETKKEVDGCIEKYGKTPTEVFEELGLYDFGGGGFHCVWMSDNDIEIFKKRQLWVVSNPASNLKLASGIADLCRFEENGIGMALGTDGAASNNALDMFREMYLASTLQKQLHNDASAFSADSVLKMACVGGARAMGLDDCDDIAVGKKADLIVLNLNKPNMRPFNNIPKNIVYSGSKDNVKLTMVNGKILYEDGEFFIGEEPMKIYEKAEELMRKIKN